MNNEDKRALAEDILFEAELIPTLSDMEHMLEQDGISLNRHAKDYLAEVAALPSLDAASAEELSSRLAQNDDRARSAFIERCMRLVICAAKRYSGRGVALLDLFQEGSLGLVSAAEEYSVGDGEFGRFAVFHILDALERAVGEAEASRRIPERLTELLEKISRSDMTLEEKLGREATPEEIAADTGLDTEEVTAVMEIMEDVASREAEKEEQNGEDAYDGCGPDSHHPHFHPGEHMPS